MNCREGAAVKEAQTQTSLSFSLLPPVLLGNKRHVKTLIPIVQRRASQACVSIVFNQWTDGKRQINHLTVPVKPEGPVTAGKPLTANPSSLQSSVSSVCEGIMQDDTNAHFILNSIVTSIKTMGSG